MSSVGLGVAAKLELTMKNVSNEYVFVFFVLFLF